MLEFEICDPNKGKILDAQWLYNIIQFAIIALSQSKTFAQREILGNKSIGMHSEICMDN